MERAQLVVFVIIAPLATFLVPFSALEKVFLYKVSAGEGSQLVVHGKYCTIPLIAKAEAFNNLLNNLLRVSKLYNGVFSLFVVLVLFYIYSKHQIGLLP